MAKKAVKKKSKKATQMDKSDVVAQHAGPLAPSMTPQETEKLIKALVARGKKRGFLTYEEMNDSLPDDAVSPARLERLLGALDEMGIRLVDENDAEAQKARKPEHDTGYENHHEEGYDKNEEKGPDFADHLLERDTGNRVDNEKQDAVGRRDQSDHAVDHDENPEMHQIDAQLAACRDEKRDDDENDRGRI